MFQVHFKSITRENINLANIGRKIMITSPICVIFIAFGTLSFYFYYDNLTLNMSLVFGYQLLNTVLILKLWIFNYLAISSAVSHYEKHFNDFNEVCICDRSILFIGTTVEQQSSLIWSHGFHEVHITLYNLYRTLIRLKYLKNVFKN